MGEKLLSQTPKYFRIRVAMDARYEDRFPGGWAEHLALKCFQYLDPRSKEWGPA